jgi:rhamnosyltransferase
LPTKKIKNIAIVAHFNENGGIDENFSSAMKSLCLIFDRIILVSTSPISNFEIEIFSNVNLILRPNIGYDFYSYKVGLNLVSDFGENVETVTLINSSFYITDMLKFQNTVLEMIESAKKFQVIGLTESKQFSWHLQSYLISINSSIINAKWFKEFFDRVNPLNNKEEIIFRYEIGFSQEMLKNRVSVISLYNPNLLQKIYSQMLWMRRVLELRGLNGAGRIRAIKDWNGINWTQFAARDIANQFGIIKKELILSNPNSIPLDSIDLSGIIFSKHKQDINSKEIQKSQLVLQYRKCTYHAIKKSNVKIAVVIHLYYADLLSEVIDSIRAISDPFDLYFTTPFEGDISKIFDLSSKISESVTVCVFPNRGRDIGPFLSLYIDGVFDQYVSVLKLHTKKSKYSAKGDEWRSLLYSKVIGGAINARKICSIFEKQMVGMVGPHKFYLTHKKFWGANFLMVKKILIEAKVIGDSTNPELGFFAGSMFWFSPKALLPLKNLENSSLEFEDENGKQDGTLAHAFERVFATISRKSGYIATSLECNKLQDIEQANTLSNRVPVL